MRRALLVTACFSLLLPLGCGSDPQMPDGGGITDRRANEDARDGRSSSDRGRADQGGDAEADAAPLPCDPLTQEPCSASDSCVIEASQLACYPAGTLALGEACGTQAGGGCVRGLVCAVPPGTASMAICMAVCNRSLDADTCAAGSACSGVLGEFEGSNAALCVPYTECDLLAPTACGAGYKCDLADPPRTQCFPDGTLAAGEPCGGAGQSCKAGSICTAVGSEPSTCLTVCDPGVSPSPCPAGVLCQELSDYPRKGVCTP